jgi:hypothetical protein
MQRKVLLTTGVAAAVVLGGATVAVAASQLSRDARPWNGTAVAVRVGDLQHDDDSDSPGQPLSDADRDRAGNAALAKVGQGRVSEVERENDGGAAYEVAVRLDNGSEVEVQLGADFQVMNQGAPEFDDD